MSTANAPGVEPAFNLSEPEHRAVVRLLSEARGKATGLRSAVAIWGRDHVARLTDDGGRTLVLKRYAGRRRGRDGRMSFAVELASLEILADMPVAVAPRLVGYDSDTLLLLMEDLPPGRSLADSLLLGTSTDVSNSLNAYASSLGRIHAWTLGRAEEFDSARRRHAPPGSDWRCWWVFGAEASRGQLGRLATAAGVSTIQVDRELTEALAILEADRYSCFIHTDPCPDNVRVTDGICRIFDFEISAAGCAALDAGYLVAPFPSCWCFGPLPDALANEAMAVYWEALGASGLVRDASWDASLAAALACYIVARLRGLDDFMTSPAPWGTTTGRPRMLSWTAAAVALTDRADVLPGLRAVFAHLHRQAAGDSPVADMAQYPALAGPGARPVDIPDWWQAGL